MWRLNGQKSRSVGRVIIPQRVRTDVPMSQPRPLPLVDTHAHVNLEDFSFDLEAFLDRSRRGIFPEIKGRQTTDPVFRPFISGLIVPGVDLASSLRAVELAHKYDYVFAAVGFHPNHVSQATQDDWEECARLAFDDPKSNKIVALGETGLDRYWDYTPIERQRDFLLQTLDLGLRAQLPVVIHSRETNDEIMATLRDFYATAPRYSSEPNYGVVHSFSGTPEQAEELIDLGFYLGFGGFVTYTSKKFSDLWEVAKRVPVDRILLETDCPFLTPHPLRGKLERNEPLTTIFVAKRLAELRDASIPEIVNQTTQNAIRLFKLPPLRETPID